MYHPSGLILISTILLLLCTKYKKIFILISAIYPILASILLINHENIYTINFFKIDLIINFSHQNRLIGLAFLVVTLVTNLYAISQDRLFEVIIGSIYCATSLICLIAGDFISMFISLEFMMICACILIFYGSNKNSIKAARQYFLTHLFSSSLILVGILYVIIKTDSTEIISLTELITNSKDNNNFFIYTLLSGCLINVAIIPFSGWIVNCYPYSSSSGLIYLITFTSKVSMMILIKLFTGLEVLKLFGIFMILYGGFYAVIENSLKRLLCYLTVSQLGLMVFVVSINSQQVTYGIIAFLFIHILYKALFSLYIAILADEGNITNCFEIKGINPIKQPLLFLSLIFSIITMVSLPPLASYTTKIAVTNMLEYDINYYIIILLKIFTCISLFSIAYNHRIWSDDFSPSLNILAKLSLFIIVSTTFIANILLPTLLSYIFPSYPIEILVTKSSDIMKQIIIIIAGVIFTLILSKIPRYSTINKNFDLFQIIENMILYLKDKQLIYYSYSERTEIFSKLEKYILCKIRLLHNQSASICTIFTLLIILIFILNN